MRSNAEFFILVSPAHSQVNLDFESEENMVNLFRVSLALQVSPVVLNNVAVRELIHLPRLPVCSM